MMVSSDLKQRTKGGSVTADLAVRFCLWNCVIWTHIGQDTLKGPLC